MTRVSPALGRLIPLAQVENHDDPSAARGHANREQRRIGPVAVEPDPEDQQRSRHCRDQPRPETQAVGEPVGDEHRGRPRLSSVAPMIERASTPSPDTQPMRLAADRPEGLTGSILTPTMNAACAAVNLS